MVLAVRAKFGWTEMPTSGAVRPVLPVFFVEQISLGLETADFGEWQFDFPRAAVFLHRHVAPGGAGGSGAAGVGGDDFAAAGGGAAEVGAEQRAPAGAPAAGAERETDAVADEAQEAFAGRGFHDGRGLRHFLVRRLPDGITIPQMLAEINRLQARRE